MTKRTRINKQFVKVNVVLIQFTNQNKKGSHCLAAFFLSKIMDDKTALILGVVSCLGGIFVFYTIFRNDKQK